MKFSISKSTLSKLTILSLVLVLFFVAFPVNAGWKEAVMIPFTWVFAALTAAIGAILMVIMYVLVWVAGYNDFINADAVKTGWVIVRDICNMFFILILLVIAFATTLNRESYSMKRLLPKFILAAIFINFSKLICGVIIDFSQVIMLTFVNGFRDIGPGNLTSMLGITKLLDFTQASAADSGLFSIFGSYVLALLYVIVATVVIIVILFVLVMRIVMLWIYVVLSPLAYLLMVLPATEKYSKQWWDQFIQNVVSGPILAFFIWLSFAAVSITSTGSSILSDTPPPNQTENESKQLALLSAPAAGVSEAGTPSGMLKIFISIGMLMGGLMVTKQLGGAAGAIAGSGFDKIKKGALKVRDWGGEKALIGAKGVGRGAVGLGGFTMAKTGEALTKYGEKRPGSRIGKVTSRMGSDISMGGQFMKDYHTDLKETREKQKWEKRKKTLEKMGMKERSMESLEAVSKTGMGKTVGAAMIAANPAMGGGYGTLGWGTAMGLKGLAKKVKKFALKNEREKNLEETSSLMTDVDVKKNEERNTARERFATERDGVIVGARQSEERETDIQKAFNKSALDDAIANGASISEINALKQEQQKSLDEIANRYSDLRNQAESKYQNDIENMNQQLDEKYAGTESGAEKHYDLAQRTIEHDTRVTEVEGSRKTEKSRLQEQRAQDIEAARKKFAKAPAARDAEIARIRSEYASKEESIDEDHDERLQAIRSHYQDAPQNPELRHFGNKMLDESATKIGDININKVTIKAAQEGAKERKIERARVEAFAGGDSIFNGSAGDYSGVAENASKHKLLWEFMSANNDTSKAALANIEKELKNLRESGEALSPKQDSIIQKLKQGIARDLLKHPERRGTFSTFISELDKHNTKDGKKTNDYK